MSIIVDFNDYYDFVKKLNKDEIDVLGDDYTSCWMFAYYFHKKYNLPVENYEPIYENDFDIKNITLNDGIYSFYTSNNTEFHHFIIEVDGNIIKLYSTYGGQWRICKVTHTKEDFINLLNKIYLDNNIHMNDKISYYQTLYYQ